MNWISSLLINGQIHLISWMRSLNTLLPPVVMSSDFPFDGAIGPSFCSYGIEFVSSGKPDTWLMSGAVDPPLSSLTMNVPPKGKSSSSSAPTLPLHSFFVILITACSCSMTNSASWWSVPPSGPAPVVSIR